MATALSKFLPGLPRNSPLLFLELLHNLRPIWRVLLNAGAERRRILLQLYGPEMEVRLSPPAPTAHVQNGIPRSSHLPTISLPQRTTVLIVGAGPCAMAAALSLNPQGIHDIIIVDAHLAGENSSRAMVIQAATLEFPFALVIPKTSTEAGMLKKLDQLGIQVRRPLKVVSVKPSQSVEEQMFDVQFESGEFLKAKHFIGADGAHSVVRNEAGIAFKDPDGDEEPDYGNLLQMVFGDVMFTAAPQIPEAFLNLSQGNFTLCVPFPPKTFPEKTGDIYRLILSVPVEDGTVPHTPSAEYIQSLMDRCGPPGLSFNPAINPTWIPFPTSCFLRVSYPSGLATTLT
ncbi:hypothetical protein K438DRAFT_1758771 [Mycena galopus ATCC 62051]|nr:hypothetical protein K438DRAFT_1758771 [Mycena galopus ATCC 62051]